MKFSRGMPLMLLSVTLSVAPGLSGCGGGEDRYIPETSMARDSVTAALQAWQEGQPLQPITMPEATLNVVDARWQSGQKLESFEILSEAEGQPQPTFVVRQQIAGEQGPVETRYIVVGIDPIYVFREEDYNQPDGM
jgi:hypothetical protein